MSLRSEPDDHALNRRKMVTFLGLTLGLSAIMWYLIISAGTMRAPGKEYILKIMWCPGLAALITQLLYHRSLRGLGWGWGRTRYQLWSYGIPLAYTFVGYSVIWITGLGGFYNHELIADLGSIFGVSVTDQASSFRAMALFVVMAGTLGMTTQCFYTLGEEIGWRGLLVPCLARTNSFHKTALLSGLIWAVWHLPVILFADYNNGTPAWYGVPCFISLLVGTSYAMAWLRLKSGSLWTGVIFHASHNKFIQTVGTQLTTDTGNTKYFIDEFGIVLAILGILTGYLFWRRRALLATGPDH